MLTFSAVAVSWSRAASILVTKSVFIMDSLPLEVLELIALIALPSGVENSARRQNQRTNGGRLPFLRRCMHKTAEWRLINHRWRTLMDNEGSTIWFHLALFLDLEPPSQLFAGGTYRDVCQYLLKAEKEKDDAIQELARRREHRPMVACGMRVMPERPQNHPQPAFARVTLPLTLKKRIADNAKALERFLKSLDYSLGLFRQKGWNESALIRYRMFLHLKRTHPDVWLVPTVDIEFCWLAHIFRTQTYWLDMMALGINPEHSICLQTYGQVATFSQAVRATAALWNETFGEYFYPYLPPGTDVSMEIWKVETRSMLEGSSMSRNDPCSFFPAMGVMVSEHPPRVNLPRVSLCPKDIAADLKWFPELQEALSELFSNGYYNYMYRQRNLFIEKQVIPSYERFLDLCRRCDVKNPAPPYVLDLVWHAHQLDPVQYKNDCLSLFGCEFWHDPWPHGLGKSTPLSKEFECQWKQTYGTRMADDWKFYLQDAQSG